MEQDLIYPAPDKKNVSVSMCNSISEPRTRIVYHIDKVLCVVLKQVIDDIALLTREDRLDQRGEFVRRESTFDQTFTG